VGTHCMGMDFGNVDTDTLTVDDGEWHQIAEMAKGGTISVDNLEVVTESGTLEIVQLADPIEIKHRED